MPCLLLFVVHGLKPLQSMAKDILILSLSCNARQCNDVKKSNKHNPLKKVVIWNRYSMAIVKPILLFFSLRINLRFYNIILKVTMFTHSPSQWIIY